MDWQRAVVVYGMLGLSVVCAASWIGGVKLRRRFKKERHPISEKIRRPPGYSLRLKVKQLREARLDWVGVLCVAPMLITAFVFAASTTRVSPWLIGILIASIVSICFWRLTFWHRKLRAHRLGLAGELIVAE